MQERQDVISQQNNLSPDTRKQQLVAYLVNLWSSSEELFPLSFQQIIYCIVNLPYPYESIGLGSIAEYIVSNMNLHFLTILKLFQEKAEQEGFTSQEREDTCKDILPAWRELMAGLNKLIVVDTLDDLVNLSNITIGLCRLYHADSAEEAQRVLYEAPQVYRDQLMQKQLLPSRLRPTNSFKFFR